MSAGAGDRRRPTQAGTAPALMPGDDPFALSAVPMFCFINASFCRVPWTCGAALVYFSTSLRAQDETPRALPQGMLYSLFPGLVVSRRETPETSSPRPPTLCGTRQAHFCNQPGVFLNFFFLQKTKPYQPGVLVHKSPQHDSWSKRTGLLTDSGFHVCLLVQGTAACSRQPLQNGHPFLLSKKHPLMWSLGKRVAQLIHTQHCK